MAKCPTCESPDPKRHPAMQFEGEVQLCLDPFHGTPDLPPEVVDAYRPAERVVGYLGFSLRADCVCIHHHARC